MSKPTYVGLTDTNLQLTTHGVVYRPDVEKCIGCYIDDDFAGEWDQSDANNAGNVMSRMGYVIMYVVCPV